MKVGVVMPVYNQEKRFLDKAVDSILTQTYKDYKVVFIVDGADPETTNTILALKDKPKVEFHVRQENRGIAFSLNEGFSYLDDAKYFTWVSSDNIYYPNFLQMLADALDNAPPDTGLVYSKFRIINRHDMDITERSHLKKILAAQGSPIDNLLKICFIGPSFMYRKSYADSINGYRSSFETVEDYDFWLRLAEVCKFQFIPISLVDYRLGARHSYTTVKSPLEIRAKSLKAIQTALGRRNFEKNCKLFPGN